MPSIQRKNSKKRFTALTATHQVIKTGSYIRVNNEDYADIYLHGLWQKSTILNEDVLVHKRHQYITLLPTGVHRVLANIWHWLLCSPYRVPKLPI